MKEILDEFVGKQLTTCMGELILKKARHRIVNSRSAHGDTMELDVTITPSSVPL